MINTKTSFKSWLALTGLCLASFLGCIDFTIMNTALPAIQSNLGATIVQLQWIINIFLLALVAFMVIAGRMADIYGRRLVLYIGLAIFAISSLGAGLSPNVSILILWRFIQGIGVAILYILTMAIIPSIFAIEKRAKVMGILVGFNGLGLAIGPVLGGLILSLTSWHWIFLINIPLIILSFLCCVKTVPESKSEIEEKIDWLGGLLLIIALPSLVFFTVEISVWGLVSVLILIGFYYVEKRTDFPIIDFNLFKNSAFMAAVVANFSLAFFYTTAFFLMPLYLHNIMGFDDFKMGMMILPASAMVIVLSPFVSICVHKYGPKPVLLIGFALLILSALAQSCLTADSSTSFILLAYLAFGIGMAFILSPSLVAAMMSVHEKVAGSAMGTVGTLHNFGGALGLAIGTAIYHSATTNLQGQRMAMYLLLTSALVAFGIIFLRLKTNKGDIHG